MFLTQFNRSLLRKSIAISLGAGMAIVSGISNPVRAEIEFNDPEEIPTDTVEVLTNEVDFQPPEDVGTLEDSISGGTRGDIDLEPPEDSAPDDSSAGGVRGDDEDGSVRDLAAPNTTQVFDELNFSLPDALAPENRFADSLDSDSLDADSADEANVSPESIGEEDVSPENVSPENADESAE